MNALLKTFTSKGYNKNASASGYVDTHPNIYVTSSGLGNFNTASAAGDQSIIKKIPATGHGEIIFDQTVTGTDYLDCSHRALSRISFTFKDVFGNVVD